VGGMLDITAIQFLFPQYRGNAEGADGPEPHNGAVSSSADKAAEPFELWLCFLCGWAFASVGSCIQWADVDWLGSRLSVRRGIVIKLLAM